MKRVVIVAVAALLVVVGAAEGAGAAPAIQAELSTSTVKLGSMVRIDGSVGEVATSRVVLQRYLDDAWSDRGAADVDAATGEFRLEVKPSSVGTYRLRVRSDDGSAVSDEMRLTVTPARVTISIALSAASVRTGTLVNIRGVLTPKTATSRVVLQRKVDGRWSDRGSGVVDPRNGAYRISIRPSQPGTYTLRVRTGGGSVWTRTVNLIVTKPKPTTPPPAPACHPSYQGACVPIGVSDVDCAGGSGDGPYYVSGPIRVVGPDEYGLDRDGNGTACENS